MKWQGNMAYQADFKALKNYSYIQHRGKWVQ